MARNARRCIVFDPLNQYKDKHAFFTTVFTDPESLLAYVREHFRDAWRILYVPKNSTVLKHWRSVGVIAYAAGDMLLCIDEIGLLCEGGKIKPDAKNSDPILEKIIHFGRHRKIEVIATSQLPTDVALRYRSLCCEMRLFKTDEPAHLDYIAGKTGETITAKLPNLPKFHFIVWKDDGDAIEVRPKGAP